MTTESPPTSAIDGLDRLPLPEPMRAQIAQWLREPAYTDVRPDLLATVSTAIEGLDAESAAGRSALAELEDAFSGPVPIGTGGRRGPCGAGPNRVNAAMMRETARGLAMAIKQADDEPKVAIIYDTRASSRTFALVVAAALVADQIKVTLIDGPRPTPQLSYLARLLGCGAGVVISASHNPPTDNGIKVYGPDGAQVLGDRDKRLMAAIIAAGESPGSLPEINLEAITAGKVPIGVEHIDPDANPEGADKPYHDYVLSQGVDADDLSESGLKVVYTPLHGVGHTAVVPVLRGRGLEPIIVEAQLPDEGRFATVASANPESPEAFAMALEVARASGADLIMATDPDADRVGAMARDAGGEYRFIDGNRLGVLMLDHVLRGLSALGSEELRRGRVLTTLVTSPLIAKLARAQDVECVDDLLVGFKFHAGAQAEAEDRPMIFACEESHGFLRGNQIRDKDGAIAALLLAECAASCKRAGHTLFERLDEIWGSHGYHREKTANLYAEGLAGRRAIASVMDRLRSDPPEAFAGLRVSAVIDRAKPRDTGSPTRDLPGNVLVYELEGEGRRCRLVFRPSGTEPKIKVYALASGRPGLVDPTQAAAEREAVDGLIADVLAEAAKLAETIMAPLLGE